MAHISHTHRHKCVNRLKEDREGVDFHLWKFQLWYFKLYLLDEILLLVLRVWTLSGRAALQQDLFETLGQNINLFLCRISRDGHLRSELLAVVSGHRGRRLGGRGGHGDRHQGHRLLLPALLLLLLLLLYQLLLHLGRGELLPHQLILTVIRTEN